MTIKYNDPRLINAIRLHDPRLALLLERWDDLNWLQRKEIVWISWRATWRMRANDLCRRVCAWFVYS